MELLLDTHTFLWFINGDAELSSKAKSYIEDSTNTKYISVASFWEMAIKVSLGKLELEMPFSDLKTYTAQNNFTILPITFEHTIALTNLEFHHRDPFDRLMIAQALTDQLSIITRDAAFGDYSVKVLW
jgi:PIN domain nuclease of toxin-antitoxin system